jgi:hypothetical protein
MSDLNYNLFRVLRDGFSTTTWSVIGIVVASIIVAGVCISSSYDGDRSSAVKDEPPKGELSH